MIAFDSDEIAEAVRSVKTKNAINGALIALIAVFALILAALSVKAESFWGLYIGGLCAFALLAAAYAVILPTVFIPARRRLSDLIYRALSDGLFKDEAIFSGGGDITFTVSYEKDDLILTRSGFTGEIKLSPPHMKEGESIKKSGESVRISLTALKGVPSEYSSAGGKLWQFLQAYYCLHAKRQACKNVSVIDGTGGKPVKSEVVTDGKCLADGRKNYYLKKGLMQ